MTVVKVKKWIETGATYAHAYVGRVLATLALAGLLLIPYCMAIAGTLLPNGQQVFLDNNGVPLTGGKVYFYFPSTTSFKTTWKDAAQTITNTNPVVLDSAGRAVVYGAGAYRQQVFDSLGNLIWDQVTTDTSASNSVFWAGAAQGTPNAILVTDAGFSATDGTIINFTALSTNTGPATLNPSAFGAVPIVKDTTGGPIALVGGEIVINNPISVIYRASDAAFHLLNTVIQSASGTDSPLCSTSGLTITNNNGSPLSVITISASGTTLANSSGLVVTRTGSVVITVNITLGTTVSTAGGMDGETVGASNWVYLYLIDNGASTSAVGSSASGFGLTPHLPAGYTYSCRVGAMVTDGSSNLRRTIQRGANAQYTIFGTTNTPSPPNAVNGVAGSGYATDSPVLATVNLSTLVPPTATTMRGIATGNYQNAAVSSVLVAPSATWGGLVTPNRGPLGTANTGWPVWLNPNSQGSITFSLMLETLSAPSFGYAASAAGGAVSVLGWTDSVAAN